ncbi:MAG TPA: hypothetical protein VG872_07060 [Acidimicrobiia bacterium]|jgi:hypothetical protein|nr:hypothetical protein [Acidimicrobiia bacterium]
MSVICEMAAPFVANSAVEQHEVARPFRSHTTSCLKCQARHAAMTRLARELSALEAERYPAPADLEWRVMSSLEGDLALARTWRKPVAWTAAVLSMAAALLIWRLRPKTSG